MLIIMHVGIFTLLAMYPPFQMVQLCQAPFENKKHNMLRLPSCDLAVIPPPPKISLLLAVCTAVKMRQWNWFMAQPACAVQEFQDRGSVNKNTDVAWCCSWCCMMLHVFHCFSRLCAICSETSCWMEPFVAWSTWYWLCFGSAPVLSHPTAEIQQISQVFFFTSHSQWIAMIKWQMN